MLKLIVFSILSVSLLTACNKGGVVNVIERGPSSAPDPANPNVQVQIGGVTPFTAGTFRGVIGVTPVESKTISGGGYKIIVQATAGAN